MQNTPELAKLNAEYNKPGNQLVVFYGRSGCKKEEYIKEFLKDKDFFYYRARELSETKQKAQFVAEFKKHYYFQAENLDYDICFANIRSRERRKQVLVIDEAEYMLKKDSDFLKSILKLKQAKTTPNPVMILLCSSSLVWTEQKMPSVFGDAFCKIDHIQKIKEMNFLDIVRTFPESSVSECVQIYGILGGIPEYLKCFEPKKTIKENVCRNILSPSGSLFFEAQQYLGNELRELSVYHTILTEIAAGHRKLNELHHCTGFSRAKVSVYMKNLMDFDVIEKVVSFETGGWENAQKGIYQIKNTFLNFWFKFVFPHLSDLYLYTPERFYDLHIAGELEKHLNRYFVQVCMEYMQLLNKVGKLPIQIHKIGTWVGKQGNIDIIAQNAARENVVGICNWSEDRLTYERYLQLDEMMKQAKISAKHYFLFSAKAFDHNLVRMTKNDKRFSLIDMTEL